MTDYKENQHEKMNRLKMKQKKMTILTTIALHWALHSARSSVYSSGFSWTISLWASPWDVFRCHSRGCPESNEIGR